MAEQQPQQISSSPHDTMPWWIRLCRWLWKLAGFLGTSVLLALGINVASTWLTTPKGALPVDTPLSEMMKQWPLFLLAGCCLFLLATFFWAISRGNPSMRSARTDVIIVQDRERMLRRLRVRYEQGIAQSLQGAVQIELGLAERPDAIENTIGLSLRLPAQAEQVLPPHTSIIDAYNQAQQELLILGEPGAGKSIQLLVLASHLVKQAEQDARQPLPVLLPLSSWAVKRSPLQDWMIDQFTFLYDVPRQLSTQWIQGELILPLLDGLDEMEEAARPGCIEAINTYHREHLGPLVVCCRTSEYDGASRQERLALHTAVVVQPLSREEIDAHLIRLGKALDALRTSLKKNPTLAILATTPLMLQVLMLTYHDLPIRGLSQKEAQLRAQIWMDYVQRMVERKGDGKHYSLEVTRVWLRWLAQQMRKHNRTIFSLEQLQPDWLSKQQKIRYRWSVGLLVGLLAGLLGGLIFGLLAVLQTKIEPVEVLVWSWEWLRFGLLSGLLVGLIFGLRSGLSFGLSFGLLVGLLAGLIFGLLVGLSVGLSGKQLTKRLMLSPNEGIRRSMKNGVIFGLSVGLVFGLLDGLSVGLRDGLLDGLSVGLRDGLLVGLSVGLRRGLWGGLLAGLQHYTLRFWLWRAHLFPLNAVSFLEDATARILLRRVGGGYSFTHRLLLDYFADLGTTTPAPSSGTHPGHHPPLP